MDLFVESEKIDQAKPLPSWGTCATGHLCTAYTSKGTTKYFSPQDKEAMNLLKQKGISFNLVDLSECSFMTKIQAKMKGVDQTPTLILNNDTRLKGIEKIKEHF